LDGAGRGKSRPNGGGPDGPGTRRGVRPLTPIPGCLGLLEALPQVLHDFASTWTPGRHREAIREVDITGQSHSAAADGDRTWRCPMKRLPILRWLRFPGRYFFWGSLLIVLFSSAVISRQITDRHGFANSELRRDVLERWGAPITQPAPSVRYVESGSVFNTLHPLPLDRQQITLDAEMNYRKRGLVYFSGFDFAFRGLYAIGNPEPHAVDVVFVFPVHVEKNRVLLSDRSFTVNGRPADIALAESSDKLVWTGQLEPGETAEFEIAFKGRGLDLFTYSMDPSLPVRGFSLDIDIRGGDNYDYAAGVVPAHSVLVEDGEITLGWDFPSLESGVPVGVILPSETSFDSILVTMIRRSWATFALFFAGLVALSLHVERPPIRHESYLIASAFAFFFVLLSYLAAYLHFYVAYALTVLVIGGLLQLYLERTFSAAARLPVAGLITALLFLPTLAVILQNYTGLIYSLEILAALALVMLLTTRPAFRSILYQLEAFQQAKERQNAN
jgi:hypothetical protein